MLDTAFSSSTQQINDRFHSGNNQLLSMSNCSLRVWKMSKLNRKKRLNSKLFYGKDHRSSVLGSDFFRNSNGPCVAMCVSLKKSVPNVWRTRRFCYNWAPSKKPFSLPMIADGFWHNNKDETDSGRSVMSHPQGLLGHPLQGRFIFFLAFGYLVGHFWSKHPACDVFTWFFLRLEDVVFSHWNCKLYRWIQNPYHIILQNGNVSCPAIKTYNSIWLKNRGFLLCVNDLVEFGSDNR